MSEEKKGRVKVTIEMEVNEALMDMMKEAMSKMQWKMPKVMKHHAEE